MVGDEVVLELGDPIGEVAVGVLLAVREISGSRTAIFSSAFQIRSLAPGSPKWSPLGPPTSFSCLMISSYAALTRSMTASSNAPVTTTIPGPADHARARVRSPRRDPRRRRFRAEWYHGGISESSR